MNELVERLSTGTHKVRAEYVSTAAELKEAIDRGIAHIKFTETRGGTVLSVSVDRSRSDFSEADFEKGTGAVQLVGSLVLNFNEVELVAQVNLESLEGHARLNVVGDETAWRAKRAEMRSEGDPVH